jgi:phenylalanyl-tRNA synthetase beta chain
MPLIVDPGTEEVMVAVIPTWRRDLTVEADVTEEVARVRGYETTPAHLPSTLMPAYRFSPTESRNKIRETLAGAGLSEAVTHALVSPADEARLAWPGDDGLGIPPASVAKGDQIVVTNPLSSQHSILRQQIVGSLLDVLALNERQGRQDVALFEVGKGYGRLDDRPHEWTRVAFVVAGNAEPPAWNRHSRGYDLEDGKGLVELLCERLHLPGPAYVADTRGYPFHPGRAMTVQARCDDGSLYGRVAELHPDAFAAWELRSERVIVAELAIGELDAGVPKSLHVAPIGRFPVMERDLAVIVDEARAAADIESVLWNRAGDLLVDARAFDVYRGAPLAETEKSVAYRLVFGSNDRTLMEAEVDSAMAAVRAGLESEVQGRIRS